MPLIPPVRSLRWPVVVSAAILMAMTLAAAGIWTWYSSGPAGGTFALTDQTGAGVSDRSFVGKPLLVFFGYTHCPDICPTTLFELSEAIARLGPDAARINAVFITVDPERDTPAVIGRYVGAFPPVRGLTGSRQAVEAAERAYGVTARKVPLSDSNYAMDHTTSVFLMDARGAFVSLLDLSAGPDAAAVELRKHLT